MKCAIFKSSILYALALLASCSGDTSEESPIQEELIINAEVSEFPNEGEVVTRVTSNLSGNLIFTLTKISKSNSFELNELTGILTVKEPLTFDFETTPIITGEVTVSNGSETEIWSLTINVQDLDDIAFWLTDSKTAYETQNSGNWVVITADEYERLASNLTGVSKAGTTDLLFQQGTSASNFFTYTNFTIANDLSSIPNDSYIFAFKYHSLSENTAGNKVKVTPEGINGNYIDLGNPLPDSGLGTHYFVIKGATKSTTGNRGFLGFYSQNGLSYDTDGEALGTHFAELGDNTTFGPNFFVGDGVCMYQGLSTTFKQWD